MRTHNQIHLYNFLAFALVLAAIVILALAGKATDLAIMTGLVGVLGSFKPWGSAPPVEHKGPSGSQDDPFAVEGADDGRKPVETTPAGPEDK